MKHFVHRALALKSTLRYLHQQVVISLQGSESKMVATPEPATITPTEFIQVLSRHKSYIASPSQVERQPKEPRAASESQDGGRPVLESLQALDTWRIHTLPNTIAARARSGRAYLSHDELVHLMKCKMKRGKFRPQLLPLVMSNNRSMVEKITREAFEYNKDCSADKKPDLDNLKLAFDHLNKNLKGVGPATASYLVAAQIPHWVPAFSDEGFRWVFLNKHLPGVIEGRTSATDQWQRPIKYTPKEYLAYVEEVWNIRERLISQYNRDQKDNQEEGEITESFGAENIEMVGWILGKEVAGWKPMPPERTEVDPHVDQESEETEAGKGHESGRAKRKNYEGQEMENDREINHQGSEVEEHTPKPKPRKPKKKSAEDTASKQIAIQASDTGGLRRSTRKRKAH